VSKNRQTVTDISTRCLSACVNDKLENLSSDYSRRKTSSMRLPPHPALLKRAKMERGERRERDWER